MENPRTTFIVKQTILPQQIEGIAVTPVHEDQLSPAILECFLASVGDGMIGLAPTYDKDQRLSSVAFSSPNRVLILNLPSNRRFSPKKRKTLQSMILLNNSYKKYAFHMDKLATSLFRDYSIRITMAVDILSGSRRSRHLLLTIIEVLGGERKVDQQSIKQLFRQEESLKADRSIVAIQSWAAYQAALAQPLFTVPTVIDTTSFSAEELSFLAKTIRDAEQLKGLKPNAVRNEIDDEFKFSGNNLNVKSTRYKSRIMRPGSNQVLKVEMTRNDGRMSNSNARLSHLNGRMARLNISGASQARKISICTIGREDPTAAEALRTNILLGTIQNKFRIFDLPFVQDIWFPKPTSRSLATTSLDPIPIAFDYRPLNGSQRAAVNAILSDEPSKRVVLIQGPPGTGKTTVIAATVLSLMQSQRSDHNIWLIAQSNVAVKNIAEKLADVHFLDFKLLVSKDFHFDWHEHLYTKKINRNVIRSDDFAASSVSAERLLMNSKVILCTLSMLSNDRIAIFTRLVPPNLFIFDEASQIEVGDYVPMLHRYQNTMCKLVFIGDDKQLPPYGQSDVKQLQSVFELPHLRKRALLLDTQYRMPVPIGNIISRHVYNNRLKTSHDITATTCCRFIDVQNGREEFRGRSWVNKEQARVAVALARKLEALQCSWRVITPYDGQRSLIEDSLKAEDAVWKDKVFNVDSFQGNEDDYIVISLVRTDKIGFLRELRRVNVMLTRCKKGMIICTDKGFINGVASKSLVASLAKVLGSDGWVPWKSVLQPDYRPFPAS